MLEDNEILKVKFDALNPDSVMFYLVTTEPGGGKFAVFYPFYPTPAKLLKLTENEKAELIREIVEVMRHYRSRVLGH